LRYGELGDACTLTTLFDRFKASGFRLADLLVEFTQTDAFLNRRLRPGI